ncbi:MAG: hypothetical protein LBH98_01145 [Chitinispirillales bacterium]|jgi:hypothetical protein|nr:hypothetical protein [Chitinispirillales bacterium]
MKKFLALLFLVLCSCSNTGRDGNVDNENIAAAFIEINGLDEGVHTITEAAVYKDY